MRICKYIFMFSQKNITPEGFTHLPWDKMAAIPRKIFANVFSWMKSFLFWLKFYWSLFLRVQLTINQHWFSGLALNRWQAIIWTNVDPIHWRIYAALGGDELKKNLPYCELKCLYHTLELLRKISSCAVEIPFQFWFNHMILNANLEDLKNLLVLSEQFKSYSMHLWFKTSLNEAKWCINV